MRFALCILLAITLPLVHGAEGGGETPQQRADRLLRQLNAQLNLKAQQAAELEIRTSSGMGALFMPRVRSILDGKSSEDIQPVMMALREVKDLPEADVDYLFQKIRWAIENFEQTAEVMNSRLLANHGPLILANYPSIEHERVIVTLLGQVHDKRLPLQEMAVTALKQSGTSLCLPALRTLAERIKPNPGNVNRLYDLAVETSSVVGSRSSPTRSVQSTEPLSASPHKTSNTRSPDVSPKNEQQDSTPWELVVVTIAAASGLLWLLLRRRMEKR